ncbi:stimulated by retinoic acid gene 6 protein-like isoform X1 [Hydra vulgaris]|uniref:Stimulated by retinoic acid gene 6 protein homolog n=1 Tax=Hydra vulgaris TaxID=6087 RepID=T2M6R0_HYDVU|nr:stimulated by retinoic acid gene 6 protein-like [Hydra vulgaris]
MVMNQERISSIASILIYYGYLSKANKPSQLLSYVNPINSTEVQNIATATRIAYEEVFDFFNTTRPCITDKATTLNNTFESNEITKTIFSSCFYVADQPSFNCDIIGWNSRVIIFIYSLAYIFVTIMMFFTKRKFIATKLCWGRPGCLIPVNMLDSYENRYGYALSFGLTVSSCFSVIFSDYSDIVGLEMAQKLTLLPSYLSVFVKMTFSAIISVSGAPFLICQSLDNQLVGCLIGLCMSLSWFVYELSLKIPILSACSLGMLELSGFRILYLLVDLPKHVCLLLLVIKFTWTVIIKIKFRLKQRKSGQGFIWMQTDKTKTNNEYIYKHVASLLSSKQKKIQCDDNNLSKFKFNSLIRDNNPGFKFSLRIILSAFISCLAVYIMLIGIFMSYEFLFGFRKSEGFFNIGGLETLHLQLGISLEYLKRLVICIKASIWIATLLSVGIFFFVMVNSLFWYRFHILSLRKGDWSFLPATINKHDLISPIDVMVASMNFAGYQVAYSIWGFIIIFILFFVILMIITTQIFLPIVYKENSFLLKQIISLWPTILIGCVIILLQRLLARFILLIEKDVLAVDNRRIFHGAAFFLFYFNIFIGIFSSFLRIIYGLILGVLFYQRIQKSSLPRSFENWDNGYMSYIGYILLEHYHTNPVLQCFVRLLLEVNERKFLKDDSDLYSSLYSLSETHSTVKNIQKTRALNRWHLYVILLQNPSLQKFRSHRIISKNASTMERKPYILFRTVTNLFSRSKYVFNDSKYLEIDENAKSTLRKLSNSSTVPLDNSNTNGQF